MAKKKQLPKTLYVKLVDPGTAEEYMQAEVGLEGINVEVNETIEVGVYKLESVRKIINKTEFVD